jgi:hypothetical protein
MKGGRESTSEERGVAGSLKMGFWNIEWLKSKLGNKDFIHWVQDRDKIAESWAGGVTLGIKGYKVTQKRETKLQYKVYILED